MNLTNTMCIEKSQPQINIYHMTYDEASKTDQIYFFIIVTFMEKEGRGSDGMKLTEPLLSFPSTFPGLQF